MTPHEIRSIADVEKALGKLNDRYTNPRRLEADLDGVFCALRKIPKSLTKVTKELASHDLCAILGVFAEADLVSREAVAHCQSLEDLSEFADYEMVDEEEFATRCEETIPFLKGELKTLLKKLEDNE